MNKKQLTILVLCILTVTAFALVYPRFSFLFHQEVPQNTIRILVDKTMDERHIRLQPLLNEKKYTFVRHGEDFDLLPPDSTRPTLQFHLIKDENTRALIFLKGDADVLYDSLSIAKTEWVRTQRVPDHARIYFHSGDSISTLALNSESPALQNPEVKKAIIAALPIKLWMETVFSNWIELLEPEDSQKKEEDLLALHLPKGIILHYLTTSSREGQQMAFLTREALAKVGITVDVRIFESSLFYAKIRKREFDLFSSTSIPGIKNILDLPHTDLIPLFRWKHGLILNSRVIAPPGIEEQLDYSFRFLSDLQLH